MKVCLLSLSTIPDDPRVRRQGDALAEAGFDVTAIGLPGARSAPPDWRVVELPPQSTRAVRLAALAVRLAAVRAVPALAEAAYWSIRLHRHLLDAAKAERADVYHCNDWRVLPAGARAAREFGVRYVYDSHEFAIEEQADKASWRFLFPGYIRRLERNHVHGAAFVSTVGDGIADALQHEYALRQRPVVIRNTPPFEAMPERAPGDVMTVLYQGVFNEDRALDELIRSVPLWRDEFRLVLRGFGRPKYEQYLRQLATSSPARARIEFAQPAPMVELVRLANEADIGIHPIPATTTQTRYCLPNKFFEYTMAGLALCVSAAPEMVRLLELHDLGTSFTESTPEAIAAAVNSFTREAVAAHKRNALRAAHELSWQSERNRLLAQYETLAQG